MQSEPAVQYAEVIGDPILHSKSPVIHGHWLTELGIAGRYAATQVPPDGLAGFLENRRSDPHWRGCNVTIPHKQAVLHHLSRTDELAALVGAVNCIVPTPAGLVGYNTDVDGIAAALDDTALEERKAVIIGAGGAARAALVYLAKREASSVVVLARDRETAATLEAIFPGKVDAGDLNDAAALVENASVIVNATPLGMNGCPPMPGHLLAAVAAQRHATLFDMVYSPVRTRFLSMGRGRTVDGLTMLVGQAARAFELFFSRRPLSGLSVLRPLLVGGAESTAGQHPQSSSHDTRA